MEERDRWESLRSGYKGKTTGGLREAGRDADSSRWKGKDMDAVRGDRVQLLLLQ